MASNSAAAVRMGPLDRERSALLQRVVDGLEPSSLHWLSGFAAGVAHARSQADAALLEEPSERATAAAVRQEPTAHLAVVYGSQTGNGKRIAERLGRAAEAAGLAVRIYAAREYPLKDLVKERFLSIVMSTHGDGDPPDDARSFHEHITGKRAPRLENLAYSVLALGDSSYPKYCETGRQLDERLESLDARRLLPRVDCDLDYERQVANWLEQLVVAARDGIGAQPFANVTRLRPLQAEPQYSRERPFVARVLANQRITGRAATKDVRHVEISLDGSGLRYEPGDALGVWHNNPPEVVDAVLAAACLPGGEIIDSDGKNATLQEWLATGREITRLTRPFLAEHARRSGDAWLVEALSPGHETRLRGLLRDLQVVDVLKSWPASWTAQELLLALRPLAPRLYSIASSQDSVGDEVHLAVAVIDYESGGERRHGAASTHLAGLTGDEANVRVFVEPNERFRLPADPSRDVIMIGPGTGVAPYRGFLQQRAEQAATGHNWLVFGARHFDSEFLYQTEWQDAVRKGLLHRVDLAFSRDRSGRAYVQDRLREAGADLYAWLEGGASIYVCGDAEHMAPDVHAALIEIAVAHGGHDRDGAETFLRALTDDRRYLRDVY
jgi:sulfite reductase (NADPH) flavoprotein alpha-component